MEMFYNSNREKPHVCRLSLELIDSPVCWPLAAVMATLSEEEEEEELRAYGGGEELLSCTRTAGLGIFRDLEPTPPPNPTHPNEKMFLTLAPVVTTSRRLGVTRGARRVAKNLCRLLVLAAWNCHLSVIALYGSWSPFF